MGTYAIFSGLSFMWHCCRVEPRSYGYSNLGDRMACLATEDRVIRESYGEKFSSGDVIGAGINLKKREIFFTWAFKWFLFTRIGVCVSINNFNDCQQFRIYSSSGLWEVLYSLLEKYTTYNQERQYDCYEIFLCLESFNICRTKVQTHECVYGRRQIF